MITIKHNQFNHFTSAKQALAYDNALAAMKTVNDTASMYRELDNTSDDRNTDIGVVVLADYQDEVVQDKPHDIRYCIDLKVRTFSGEATFDPKTGSLKTLRSTGKLSTEPPPNEPLDKYNCSFSSDDKEEHYTALGLTVHRDKKTGTLHIETQSPLAFGVNL